MPRQNPGTKQIAQAQLDAQGLTLPERRILTEIAMTGSWMEAATNLGYNHRQVRNLFKKQAFKEEYDKLFDTEELKSVQREMEMVAGDVAKIYEEAKNAELVKRLPAVCPSCGHKFTFLATVMDWSAKLKAGEVLLRVAGLLRDNKNIKVEGSVQHTVLTLTADDLIMLQRIKAGFEVPPHKRQHLIEIGAIEAEYRVIEEGEENAPDTDS